MGVGGWLKGKASAGAKAAPGFIKEQTLGGPFGRISKGAWIFIIIFLSAVAGYNFGGPLLIPTGIAWLFWTIVNWGLAIFGVSGVPEFMLEYSFVVIRSGTGFILNGIFGFMLIKSWYKDKDQGKGIMVFLYQFFIVFPLTWVFLSIVITSTYTGYIPVLTDVSDGAWEISPSVCDIQNAYLGGLIGKVSCDIGELEQRIKRAEKSAEFSAETGTGLFGGLFGAVETDAGGGTVFKSKNVNDDSVVNRDAGSSLSDLRSSRLKFTSYDSTAEDIKILANLEVKSLFLSNVEDSKIRIFINPQVDADLICNECSDIFSSKRSCLEEEINNPFDAFEFRSNGELKTITYGPDNILNWCTSPWSCNIPGAERIDTNEFLISSGFNQQIECIHSGLSLNKSEFVTYDDNGDVKSVKFNGLGKPIPVDVDFSYDARAVSTKQFFILDREILRQSEDPIQSLGLSEFVISKSYNDRSVGLGIGTDRSFDFIEPTYDDDFSMDITDIGLSFNMRRSGGYKLKINTGMLWVQVVDDSIKFVCSPPHGDIVLPRKSGKGWTINRECNKGDWAGNFIYEGKDAGYHRFKLNEERVDTDLKAGEVVNFYVNVFVPEAALSSSTYQGLLVESEINYTYTSRDDVMVRITHDDYA